MSAPAACKQRMLTHTPGSNFIELQQFNNKHNKILLIRIRLPAKVTCHMYNLWLVSRSFVLSSKLFSTISCLSCSIKLGSEVKCTHGHKLLVQNCLRSQLFTTGSEGPCVHIKLMLSSELNASQAKLSCKLYVTDFKLIYAYIRQINLFLRQNLLLGTSVAEKQH